jgi:hypothetical protein
MRDGDTVAQPGERARHLGDAPVLLDRLNHTQRADLLVETTDLGFLFSLLGGRGREPPKNAPTT